jgi:hypothetical protein
MKYYAARRPLPISNHYVQGFDQIISDLVRCGWVPSYLNFMFHHLPGGTKRRKEIMTAEVTRVHETLMHHIVRKPESESWAHLRPIFIGSHDWPIWKRKKVNSRLHLPNLALHFNAIALVPPTNPLPLGIDQHPIMPKQSKLHVSLATHFEQKSEHYLSPFLYRIHVTEIEIGTMADYTLKAFKRGTVEPDDILVLR